MAEYDDTIGKSNRIAVLEEAAALCSNMASALYVEAASMSRADLCLGEEAKISSGKFTLENLKALEAVRAKFGGHYALAEAARRIRALSAT